MSIVPRNYKTTYTTIVTRNMNFVLHCTICEELIKRRGRMINIRYKLLKSHSIVVGLGDKGRFFFGNSGHLFSSRCFHTYKTDLLLQNCSPVQIWSNQSQIQRILKNIFFQVPQIVFLLKPCDSIWSHNSKMV